MLEVDPIASMRIWAVSVDIGPLVARIPPTPAVDWMPCLMRMDVMAVFDLVEGFEIEDALMDGTVTTQAAREGAVKLLESAAGRPCWTSMALVTLAHRYWLVVGADLMRASVKFDRISLGAALDAMYGAITKGMDDKAIKRLNNTLERAPIEFQLAIGGQPVIQESARPVRQLPASAMQYVQTRPKTVLRKPPDPQPSLSVQPSRPLAGPVDSGLSAMNDSLPVSGDSHPEA